MEGRWPSWRRESRSSSAKALAADPPILYFQAARSFAFSSPTCAISCYIGDGVKHDCLAFKPSDSSSVKSLVRRTCGIVQTLKATRGTITEWQRPFIRGSIQGSAHCMHCKKIGITINLCPSSLVFHSMIARSYIFQYLCSRPSAGTIFADVLTPINLGDLSADVGAALDRNNPPSAWPCSLASLRFTAVVW